MGYLIMLAINIAISIYLAKQSKQKRNTISPLAIDPTQQPLADEVSNFQLLYGKVALSGNNCTYYGDYSTFKIYTKVKTSSGLFGSSTQKVEAANGYRLGFALSCGYGETRLYGIQIDDKYIYKNENVNTTQTSHLEFSVSDLNFFGKYEEEGGIEGKMRWYAGTGDQSVDNYLQNCIGEQIPAYLHESYLVAENFYFGNQNVLPKFVPILGRYPEVSFLNTYRKIVEESCNPINIICDTLTKRQFGINLSVDKFDTDSFIYAQDYLFNEGFGMSFNKQDDQVASELIDEVNKIIDGQLRINFSNGKLQYKLNRQDYDITSLVELNLDNIISVSSFSTNASAEAVVEYKVTFTDISDNFKQKVVPFHNDGKYSETRQPVSKSADYLSVTSEKIARKIALRDALPLTQQFVKIELKLADNDLDLNIGDVVAVKLERYKIKRMPMRVSSIDFGDSSDSSISIKLVQDLFAKVEYVSTSSGSCWSDIDFTAKDVDLTLIEAPYQLTSDAVFSSGKSQVIALAKNTTTSMTDYAIYNDANLVLDSTSPFTPDTSLYSSLGRYDNMIVLKSDKTLTNVSNETETNIRKGFNLCLITENDKYEFVSFTTISSNILSNVKRGLLDSIPQNFTNSAKIYFISYGFSITENVSYSANEIAKIKAQTRTAKDTLDLNKATIKSLAITNRSQKPLICNNLKINGNAYADNMIIGAMEMVTVTFSFRNRQKDYLQYYTEINNNNTDDVTHRLTFYNQAGTIINQVDTKTNSYTFSNELLLNMNSFYKYMKLEIKAIKNGFESDNKYSIIITRP